METQTPNHCNEQLNEQQWFGKLSVHFNTMLTDNYPSDKVIQKD